MGGQVVALLAARVVPQRTPRGAVRIVFDRRHARRDAELVAAEVDPPVPALVAAALPPVRDVPLVVAPARALQRLEQRLFGRRLGDVREVGDRAETRRPRDPPLTWESPISPPTTW